LLSTIRVEVNDPVFRYLIEWNEVFRGLMTSLGHAHFVRHVALSMASDMGIVEKFGVRSVYTECSGHGNKFELIPTVKLGTRHPAEGSFGNEFSSIYNH